MEAERAVAELERFLADRGDQLLRTATLLAGSRARLPFRARQHIGAGTRAIAACRVTDAR